MKQIYLHISFRKTLVLFALSNLGFLLVFNFLILVLYFFILCPVSFFLSLFLYKTHRIASFSAITNKKAKTSHCRPLCCPKERFPPHLSILNKNCHLLFTLNHLDGQQPGFSSRLVLINNKRQ